MTRHVTFECDESDALNIIEDVLDTYGRNGVWLVSAKRHDAYEILSDDDDEIDDDDITPDDVVAVLRKMDLSHDNKLSRMRDELVSMAERGEHIELSVRDGVPHIDSDPTPPHGTPRPTQGYWVDKSLNPTQGSGPKVPGIERVSCTSCGAPVGEVCITGSHAPYRKGYGHSTRRVSLAEYQRA